MIQIDFKLKGKCGIYSILNLQNGKRYIGSSINLYNRLHEHWNNLKNDKSHNKYLQAAWNKYEEENFTFNILEFCEPEERFNREQYYMDFMKPEYNFVANVIANLGRDMSEEQKKKISNTLKEKYKSGELKPHIREEILKECWIYNISNWTLAYKCKTYVEAAQKINVDRDTISTDKIKKRIYRNKYIILRRPLKYLYELKNLVYSNFFTAKSVNTNYIILQIPDSSELQYYRSYSACSKDAGCSPETLRNHISATKDNPYTTKSGLNFFTSQDFIPFKETAVPIEKSSELLSGNIGETPEMDNTEINIETKESISSYSVDNEPLN